LLSHGLGVPKVCRSPIRHRIGQYTPKCGYWEVTKVAAAG
jgi:hypothetical protein